LAAVGARADEPSVTIRDFDPTTGAAPEEKKPPLTYLSLGPLFSLVDANTVASSVVGQSTTWNYAIGLEGSLERYVDATKGPGNLTALGYGAFVQAQLENAKYFRCDLGIQGTLGVVGLELGLGMRQGDGTFGTTGSLHTGLFLSLGYVVISYRISPALFSLPSNEPSFGLDTAVTFALKLPIVIQGHDPTGLAVQAGGSAR
jgi:hypothetical protein